ncbi:hypothetical protein CONPUDRAFT_169560 [Coniophora puteana RWD-64-598 SS2]|uniref:RNI-like protein n=1 Tax=Coniophora puteana (strain RWD-64-598) TaxID=741705 RepID=A0A5M3M7D5_CONPW|nr:uncharacterized protein CONPUDRAFT_169560 [Coniophora puteana RWD-64-598 SS2]EIW75148.1 hypothetical protein CONPUDRAFT_169560 [Coniophora puteana RWD-64-598 SS2]
MSSRTRAADPTADLVSELSSISIEDTSDLPGDALGISTPESVAMINAFRLPSLKRLMIHRARYNPSYTQTELFQLDSFLGGSNSLTTLQLSDQAIGLNGLLRATNPVTSLAFNMSSRYLEVLRRLVYDPKARSASPLYPALRTLKITGIADSELSLLC